MVLSVLLYPSYTVRQLFDLQHGFRNGPWSALMRAAVQKLTCKAINGPLATIGGTGEAEGA